MTNEPDAKELEAILTLKSVLFEVGATAFARMAADPPRGHRMLADCQALLGALMLLEQMGLPTERLAHIESAESLGAEMARARRRSDELRAIAEEATHSGAYVTLPCPGCGAQTKPADPETWTYCGACGRKSALSLRIDANGQSSYILVVPETMVTA